MKPQTHVGNARIACIGAITFDVAARASRVPEPGTSTPGRIHQGPGGVAGNIARSLAKLGASVSIFALVGDDAAGATLTAALRRDGVDVTGLQVVSRAPTSTYVAVIDPEGEMVAAVADTEAMEHVDQGWLGAVAADPVGFEAWVVDANLSGVAVEELFRLRPPGTFTLIDPVSAAKAGRIRPLLSQVDVLTPDRREAEVLTGIDIGDLTAARRAVAALLGEGVATVILKLGEAGVVVGRGDTTRHLEPIQSRRVVDVTGAGDALAAGFLYGRAVGATDPVLYGLAAASLTVESVNSVAGDLSVESLQRRLRGVGRSTSETNGTGVS